MNANKIDLTFTLPARRGYVDYAHVSQRNLAAGPAKILGLTHKGHLGPGAGADITIYTPHKNKETMFELPRHVIKSGQVMIENGEIRDPFIGKTLHAAPDYDRDVETDIQEWFEKYYSIGWRNYPVDDSYRHDAELVSTAC